MLLHRRDENGELNSINVLSRVTFAWVGKTLKHGNKIPLQDTDLLEQREKDSAKHLTSLLDESYTRTKKKTSRKDHTLLMAIFKCFAVQFTTQLFYAVVVMICSILLPVLLALLATEHHSSRTVSYLYAGGLGAIAFAMAVFRQLAVYDGYSVGAKVKIALMGLIYRKILRLSSSYHHDVTPGYMSMECKTIERACRHVTWCIMVPVHLVIVTALSWQYVGWLSLVGSGLFVVLLLSQGISRKVASTLSRRVAEYSANRVATVRQVVTGIRSVKMLAWESPLMSLISDLRRRELRYIRLRFLLTCYNHVTSICSSPLVSLVIFPAYAILGNELVAANVFATVALYSSLNITTANTSSFASIFTETLVAAQKLQMFLESEEFQGALQLNRDAATTKSSDKVEYFINPAFQLEKTSSTDVKLISFKSLEEKEERRKLCVPLQATLDKNRFKPKVVMQNACYGSLAKSVLSDITLKLKGSRLIGITGPCGSGKSSLLLAILNEMSLISGEAVVQGETVYVPQVPWVYAGTLRDNVLFGAPYDETRYWSVINACALSDDIVALPNGDLTTIGGSGGVSLSIGQQSRVSLARAAYRMSDIYLFDEPFCAISDSTSTHFISKCICGFLSSSLRILVTRHSDYLKKADHVVMLEDGRIANQGSFTELKHSILLSDVPKKAPEPSQSGQPRTLDDSTEENKSIHLSGGIYLRYLRNGGNPFFLAILLLLVLSEQSLLAICDWWLAYWTGMTYPRQRDLMYVHVLAGLLGGALVIVFVCFVGEQFLLSRASKVTHEKMVVALLKAPLLFFDTNTSESILKRFSRDVAITDEALPASLTKSLHGILSQSAVIILCVAVNYWVTLAAVPLLVVVVLLKRFAQRSFRDLRSLESSLRTPVNSHLVETAQGLISIRAYRSQEYFSKLFHRYLDSQVRPRIMLFAGLRWLSLRLDICCAFFIAIVAIASVLVSTKSVLCGLSLLYAIQLMDHSQRTGQDTTETHHLMTSPKRMMHFGDIEPERGYNLGSSPPLSWPVEGAITCKNLSLSYQKEGPKALHNLYFEVKPRERISIVGKAGAGKSSLVAALFQMPPPEGEISIDGHDIKCLYLQKLRKHLSVVPQNPSIFPGTLRFNLDAIGSLVDDELWRVLEIVQLRERVESLPDGLGFRVSEHKIELSTREKQLLCLARALLQNNRVVIIDEAFDDDVSAIMEETVRTQLQECTVITIAHRLGTIMASDRVMVMREGRIIEFDEPEKLAELDEGDFSEIIMNIS